MSDILNPLETVQENEIPARIQLLPAGSVIIGKDGRQWKISNAQNIVDASNAFMSVHPIDENHSVDLKGQDGSPSPAFGWFKNITLEATGEIWADVEWNEKGLSALKNKE
ncbi:MAG: phage protease, partial [Treponemataceae bacterium]